MSFDFDTPHERRGTSSIKWSRGQRDGRWIPYEADGGSPQDAELLPMWLADMDFTTAHEITEALAARVEHGVFGYTAYDEAFYDAVAGWSQSRHGWRPMREWILTNSGIMPAINLLIQTFTEPGQGVIVQPPVFHPIPEAAELNGRHVVPNPLQLIGGRYEIDFAHLEARAADPGNRVLLLCNPHNPVGRTWSRTELRAIADICAAGDLLLVSDEIHGDLTYPWATFVSAGSLGTKYHDRLIVCTGPSKAFNLPGLKLSLTIIPDSGLREAYRGTLRKLNELWGANILGAAALEAAYTKGEGWLDELIAYLADNVAYVEDFVATRLPQLSLSRPDALYLLWIDCRRLQLPSSQLDSRLRAAGLWVEQGATYGQEGEGFIRMTIACSRSVLREGMERLATALA